MWRSVVVVVPDQQPPELSRAVSAGLRGRCPNCGVGPLFDGFLKVRRSCPACGFDLSSADTGDGPAVFVILIAGAVVGIVILTVAIALNPPIWVQLALALPLSVVASLGLLRPFKGLLVALQFRNNAGEHKRS